MISRRDALQRLTLLLGGALSAQLTAGVLGQVINLGPSVLVSAAQQKLLTEVADTIIPTTDTPGSKAAGAEQFIIRVLRDCYVLEDQEAFYDGLSKLEDDSHRLHNQSFADLDAARRHEIVKQTAISNKAFFHNLRTLTVTGYFCSEIGATKALEYLPIPGRFEGDVPFKPGQKAWAL